jgi:hypothetical protein
MRVREIDGCSVPCAFLLRDTHGNSQNGLADPERRLGRFNTYSPEHWDSVIRNGHACLATFSMTISCRRAITRYSSESAPIREGIRKLSRGCKISTSVARARQQARRKGHFAYRNHIAV